MDFNAGRDSCDDNVIELLCITGHRLPHTNAKTGLPPSQQGFGAKKGGEARWKQLCCGGMCYPWQEQQTLGTTVCAWQVSALHGLALIRLTSFFQKISSSVQSSPASSVVVYSSRKQGFAKAVSLFF